MVRHILNHQKRKLSIKKEQNKLNYINEMNNIKKVNDMEIRKKTLNVELNLDTEFIDFDINIATPLYKTFFDLTQTYNSLFDNKKEAAIFSLYLNDSEFIMPQDFELIRQKKLLFTYDRFFLEHELLDPEKKYVSLIKYRPLTSRFFHNYEIISNFTLLDNKSNILEISNRPSFLEACYYYEHKYKKSVSSYSLYYMLKYKSDFLDETFNQLDYGKYYSRFIKAKTFYYEKSMIDLIEYSLNKYDVIVYNMKYIDKEIGELLLDHLNTPLYLAGIICCLKNLTNNGNFVLVIDQLRTKAIADLLIICQKYFEKTVLYYPEVHNNVKMSGTVAIFKGFLGIDSDIFHKLSKAMNIYTEYDSSLIDFNINDAILREKYGVTRKLDQNKQYRYINGFIKGEIDNRYDFISNFNKKLFIDKINKIEKLIALKTSSVDIQIGIIKEERVKQITNAILYAKKYGFDYIEYEEQPFDNELSNIILQNMYSYDEPILFKFKLYTKDKLTKTIPIPKLYNDLSKRIFFAELLIDTRHINQWYKRKLQVRYYMPEQHSNKLTDYVMKNYNTGKISQAWLKMYEILTDVGLFPSDKDTIKSFHICEAPGNFISAINHFLKTSKPKRQFIWQAQSLNPVSSEIIGDDYGYIKKYPDRWVFGKDNSGDITKDFNIEFYNKYTQSVDFITSDCGLAYDSESVGGGGSVQLLKVGFAQMLFMINNLPKGKNCVMKFYMPVQLPIQISIIYTLYISFKHLFFYKGVINPFSREFYIVCKGYVGVIDELKKKLFSVLNDFDLNTDIYSNEYPQSFIYQLNNVLTKLVNNYLFNFNRQLYYVDNYDIINKKHLEEVHEIIRERNISWCRKMNLKPIDTADRL